MNAKPSTPGSLFAFLFSEEHHLTAQEQYQAALEKAEQHQEMPVDANVEETLRSWSRSYGVTSWHSARESN